MDSLFCCLGSQTKNGEETFVKVDKTYPLKAADIALNNSNFFIIFKKFLIICWSLPLERIKVHGFYILKPKAKYRET